MHTMHVHRTRHSIVHSTMYIVHCTTCTSTSMYDVPMYDAYTMYYVQVELLISTCTMYIAGSCYAAYGVGQVSNESHRDTPAHPCNTRHPKPAGGASTAVPCSSLGRGYRHTYKVPSTEVQVHRTMYSYDEYCCVRCTCTCTCTLYKVQCT